MTQPGIEPRSPGPLANTLTILPIMECRVNTALVWQSVKEKENSEFQPVELCLKIDLVSHSVQGQEGLDTFLKQHNCL